MPSTLGIVASHRVAAGFDPLSIPWYAAFWASDPGWTPPADGGAVTSWRNAGNGGSAAATQGAGANQPVYRSAYANLNAKPAIQFDGTNDFLGSAGGAMPQPNHIVAVGWLDPTAGADPTVVDGLSERNLIRNQVNGTAILYGGGAVWSVTGGGRTGPFVMVALFNGTSSTLRTNGTSYGPSDVGTQQFSNIQIGGVGGSYCFKGGIAFVGVCDRALTAPEITDLENWAETYYGVPIP